MLMRERIADASPDTAPAGNEDVVRQSPLWKSLSHLEKRQADGERHNVPVPKRPHDACQNRRLADDDRRDNARKRAEVLPGERRIEKHADGREKQHAEQVAQRHDVAERLVGIFRLVDDETSDECSDGHRQPE
jgi:hypothetical protein